MNCLDVQQLLHPFTDGELDLAQHVRIEEHLAGCSECAERQRAVSVLQNALKAAPLYHRAPDSLRARIQSIGTVEPASTLKAKVRPRLALVTIAAAVVLLAGTFLAAALVWSRSTATAENLLAERIVTSHVRSLQVDHLTDVASSDQHTVKPWFQGKLDFAPRFADLSADGFTLVGGRLDYLGDRPVASIVYRRRQHIINLFTWPASSDEERSVRLLDHNGYHIGYWQHSGATYWAISDLNIDELREFIKFVQDNMEGFPH